MVCGGLANVWNDFEDTICVMTLSVLIHDLRGRDMTCRLLLADVLESAGHALYHIFCVVDATPQ